MKGRKQKISDDNSQAKDRSETESELGVHTYMGITENNITTIEQADFGLLEQILSPTNLNKAYKQVKSNKGSEGVDGLGVEVEDLYNTPQCQVNFNSNANDSMNFIYTDNLGSVIVVTDIAGTVKRRFAYNPWGARRNADNWNEADNLSNLIINRGYTGHEHLDAFGIINMNGRVYDPVTAQFLSPDPFLQAPEQWLNYNRYSYVMNNPMLFTDPSGYRHKNAQELEKDNYIYSSYTPEPYWSGGRYWYNGGVSSPSFGGKDFGPYLWNSFTDALSKGWEGNWGEFSNLGKFETRSKTYFIKIEWKGNVAYNFHTETETGWVDGKVVEVRESQTLHFLVFLLIL